jgi:outer membrane protein assembly factor BamB
LAEGFPTLPSKLEKSRRIEGQRAITSGIFNMFALAEATPSGYREKGRFAFPEKGQLSWAHPAISDGRLYVRNQDTLLVYDIKTTAP